MSWFKWLQAKNFFDIWSVPHFLFGSVVAMIANVFSYPFLPTLFITLILAVCWEFLEMKLRIREASWNVFSDIILPLLAFMVTTVLVTGATVQSEQRVALLIVTIIFYTLVNYAAWRSRFEDDPDFLN